MRIIEKMLCILAVAGYVFVLLFWTGGEFLTTMSLLCLALLYLFLGFALFNGVRLRSVLRKSAYSETRPVHIAGAIACGIALFCVCVGILFGVNMWVGYTFLLVIGILSGGLVVIASLILKRSGNMTYHKRILTRAVPLVLVSVVLLIYSPRKMALRLLYKDHPAYIEATEAYWNNHSDHHALEKMMEEQERMHNK